MARRRKSASRTKRRSCRLVRRQQRSMYVARHGRWSTGRELVAPGEGLFFVGLRRTMYW
jgi:hypothetical protein